MIFRESETVEFKEVVVEDIKKEIIAFANCDGGKLYIGIRDDGTVAGLDNPDSVSLQISNMVRDAIKPDVTMFLHYKTIKEDGKEYIGQYIDKICTEWMEKPVCDIVIMLEEKLPETKQNIWETYVEFIQHKFGNFLYTLNIQKVIESKIIDYDFNELENMIMEISKKELNALVWLGGLLGVIMGFVNLLF